jgi:hypothetical protein
MAEKEEKLLPIREQDDGTVLVAVEAEKDPFEDQEKDEKASDTGSDSNGSGDDHDDDAESAMEADDGAGNSDGETDEDREKIREARREERRLKKDLAKQREASAKHKISALERRNEELARRLAAVESAATSFQFAQVDKAIDDESTRVEYAKMKLLQASQAGNAEEQVEYLEQLQEAKLRLNQMQAYKKQQVEQVRRPRQNVPNEVSRAVQENAESWLAKNKWYDPQARDTDSRIAKVIDNEMASEGWDPSDPEYWDELDNRLTARLPHRYAAKSGGSASKSRPNPTASSRAANPSAVPSNAIKLSPERVRAIKDAGAWDDPASRNRMIKAYMAYDKQNRN